jgi:hypothetical protein
MAQGNKERKGKKIISGKRLNSTKEESNFNGIGSKKETKKEGKALHIHHDIHVTHRQAGRQAGRSIHPYHQ